MWEVWEGVVLALRDIAVQAGLNRDDVGAALKCQGRLHLEACRAGRPALAWRCPRLDAETQNAMACPGTATMSLIAPLPMAAWNSFAVPLASGLAP